MSFSTSVPALMARNSLAASGAKKHGKALPPKAAEKAASLAKRNAKIEQLNNAQEAAKAALAAATKGLRDELRLANQERQAIIRFAEATFGPKGVEIKDFRSTTDAKVSKGKGK